jgi:mannose-6-phosphate isomerase-like protein (cupin superfamily)
MNEKGLKNFQEPVGKVELPSKIFHTSREQSSEKSKMLVSNSRVVLGRVILEPGDAHPANSHNDEEEYYYIVRGSGMIQLDESEYSIEAGDVVQIPAGTRHGIRNSGKNPIEYLYFGVLLND